MRYLILILLPFLSIFFQSTFFSTYTIKGALPDLILIFVLFYALLNGSKNAATYGFLCGLLEDLYMGRFIGINALAKGATAYLIGKLEGNVFKENIFVGIITVIFGSLINGVFIFLLSFLIFQDLHFDYSLVISLLYQVVYNILLTVPLYTWYYHSSQSGVLRTYGDS